MSRRPPARPSPRSSVPRGTVFAGCALTALTVVSCAALLVAAALVPAPSVVLPLVALVCIGCPMLAAWELSRRIWAARTLGSTDAGVTHDAQAIEELRRALARLPETRHPLGL